MEYSIKQLSQNDQIFFPQTSAEAVIVKDKEQVITLDKVLEKKVENIITPVGSGLQSFKQEQGVIITHSNSIEANQILTPNLIKYDNRGHIIEAKPFNSIILTVDMKEYLRYNGQEEKEIKMGNDFGIDNNNIIIIKWNNI